MLTLSIPEKQSSKAEWRRAKYLMITRQPNIEFVYWGECPMFWRFDLAMAPEAPGHIARLRCVRELAIQRVVAVDLLVTTKSTLNSCVWDQGFK
jgi:hypothetical protein